MFNELKKSKIDTKLKHNIPGTTIWLSTSNGRINFWTSDGFLGLPIEDLSPLFLLHCPTLTSEASFTIFSSLIVRKKIRIDRVLGFELKNDRQGDLRERKKEARWKYKMLFEETEKAGEYMREGIC